MNQKQQLAQILQQFLPYAEAFKLLAQDIGYLGDLESAVEQRKREHSSLVELNDRFRGQIEEAKKELGQINEQVILARAEGQGIVAEAKRQALIKGQELVDKAKGQAQESERFVKEAEALLQGVKKEIEEVSAERNRINSEIGALRARIA